MSYCVSWQSLCMFLIITVHMFAQYKLWSLCDILLIKFCRKVVSWSVWPYLAACEYVLQTSFMCVSGKESLCPMSFLFFFSLLKPGHFKISRCTWSRTESSHMFDICRQKITKDHLLRTRQSFSPTGTCILDGRQLVFCVGFVISRHSSFQFGSCRYWWCMNESWGAGGGYLVKFKPINQRWWNQRKWTRWDGWEGW